MSLFEDYTVSARDPAVVDMIKCVTNIYLKESGALELIYADNGTTTTTIDRNTSNHVRFLLWDNSGAEDIVPLSLCKNPRVTSPTVSRQTDLFIKDTVDNK